MVALTRRVFLAGCGVVAVGAASTALPMTWDDVYRLASEQKRLAGSGVLVLITLYGGNDGINTVIPYTQDAYFDARPELAYSGEDVIDLDGEFGLNPGMKGLGQHFRDGSLAIVRGVGYPDQDRSHFRSMDIWQTGSVDNGVSTGWIGRWLDTQQPDPLRAVNIGPVLPILAIGSKTMAATLSPENLSKKRDHAELISALANAENAETGNLAAVRESYRAASDSSRRIHELLHSSDSPAAPDLPSSDKSFGSQLDVVSRCIRAGLTTKVYCVSLSGFDTHANEKIPQQSLLKTLDVSVTKFLKEMSDHPLGSDVVVMAYSEFGRRVAANASDGTDHGTSGPVFIAGTPVKGGFYGDDPSLTDLANDDLKTTTDFRDVYAELLTKTLGTDPDPIVGAKRNHLGFLA